MRFLVLTLLVIVVSPIRAADFYVAPNGNDGWTGLNAAPNNDRTNGPFATLEAARDAVRRLRGSGAAAGPVTIHVRGGTYLLNRTLELAEQDSGTAQAPVLWRAFENEKPRLLGGRFITGFKAQKNGIYTADVSKQGFANVHFRQLLMDGKRQHLARYPNFDPANPYGGGWAYVDGKPVPMYATIQGEDMRTLAYRPEDERSWANPTEGEVMVFPRYNWWNNIVPIAQIDPEKRTVTLQGNASYEIRPGDRYYVRGVREELDAPGEWYLDRKTATLSFIPPKPIAHAEIYAPTLATIVEIDKGRHITFQGFLFEACERTAIRIRNAEDVRITASTLRNVGGRATNEDAAVKIEGGTRCGVVGCDINDVGSSGIHLIGGNRETLTPANHYAVNNYIHHTGVFYKQGVGVALLGVGSRAANNLIHDCPRFGIQFSGNDLVMENNHIRHVNLETADTGAIYTGGRDWVSSRGSIIRHNYIHDILGYGRENGRWVSPHYAWGVYLDDNTGGVDVIGNIIVRTIRGGIHLHNGRDNRMENNILVDHQLQQVEYNGWAANYATSGQHMTTMIAGYEKYALLPAFKKYRNLAGTHPRDAIQMSGNEFVRNIICYRGDASRLYKPRRLPFDHFVCDYNLIFHHGKPLLVNATEARTAGAKKAPNADVDEWAAWKANGLDAHSVVADPLFMDAGKDDYRLKPDSPAYKLGFKPIPIDKIGPFQDPLRAAWPIVEAEGAREKPLVSDQPAAE